MLRGLANKNYTSLTQTPSQENSYTETVTHTRKWQFNNATAIKGNVKVAAKIPFFAGGSIQVGLEDTFSIGHERWEQNSKSKTETFKLSLATAEQSRSKVTAYLVKCNIEVPFTATIREGSETKTEEGVFHSEYYDTECVYTEEKLASD